MSHGTKMYESRYNQNESCHVAHMNAPCLTFEQFMSWQAHQRCRVEDKLALGGLRGQSWVKCADSTSVCVCVLRVFGVCVALGGLRGQSWIRYGVATISRLLKL